MFNRLFTSPAWVIGVVFVVSSFHHVPAIAHDLTRYEVKILLRHKIDSIIHIATSDIILNAVKTHNKKELLLKEIQQRDEQWRTSDNKHPLKVSMWQNQAGRYLKRLIENNSDIYSEAFLTDIKGANIAAYPVTSDYWQGDEEKWIRAFNQGDGDIYIGHVEYDESSKTSALQISVPVIENHQALGVLVVGIKLTYLQARYLAKQSSEAIVH